MKILKKVINSFFSLGLLLLFCMNNFNVYAHLRLRELCARFCTAIDENSEPSVVLQMSNDIYNKIIDKDVHLSHLSIKDHILIAMSMLSATTSRVAFGTYVPKDSHILEPTDETRRRTREMFADEDLYRLFLTPVSQQRISNRESITRVLSGCIYTANDINLGELFNKYKRLPEFGEAMSELYDEEGNIRPDIFDD